MMLKEREKMARLGSASARLGSAVVLRLFQGVKLLLHQIVR